MSVRRLTATADGAAAEAGPIRLLLIEADEVAARQLRRKLRECGAAFEVATVGRLDTALAHLATTATDAVLVDLALPESGGLDTLSALRARRADLPILVLAGSDDEELALRALGAGASDYLLKGRVTGDLVARAVQYAIERERLLVAERESRRDAEAARDGALQTQRALETSEKRRRALLGSMLRAEEAERQRIAVELHDDTIQVMVAALVGMDACQATIDRDDPGGALESMARARATLAEAVDRVRRMSFELRPPLARRAGARPGRVRPRRRGRRRVRARDAGRHRAAPVRARDRDPGLPDAARAGRKRAQARAGAAPEAAHARAGGGDRVRPRRRRRGVRLAPVRAAQRPARDAAAPRPRCDHRARPHRRRHFAIDSGTGGGTSVRFTVPIHRQGDVRAG